MMEIDQLKKCEEAFEVDAQNMDFCLDKVWGTYENPYKEHDAKLAYELFKKGWQAAQAVPEGFVLVSSRIVGYVVSNKFWRGEVDFKSLKDMPPKKWEDDQYDIEIPLYAGVNIEKTVKALQEPSHDSKN